MNKEEITTIKRYFENKDYTINGIKVHNVIQEMTDLIKKQQKRIEELEKYKQYYETTKIVCDRNDYISKDEVYTIICDIENDYDNELKVGDVYKKLLKLVENDEKQRIKCAIEDYAFEERKNY